jgi:hypothetical protein
MSIKKYLSIERLSEYDVLLKAKMAQDDASTLESAKEYVNNLMESVNTSIGNITNGDVVVKEAEHATSADSATSSESATKANQDGNGNVIADTYETKDDATTKLTEAKEYTDGKVNELKSYVGTIPETATATDIVGYVQEMTDGIATEGAMTELSGRVGVIEGKVDAIESDYLTSTDKEELQGNIDTVASAVELLTNGVDAETVDGVNDLIAYVNEHGTEVTGMKADIKANTDALAGLAEVAKTGSWNDLTDKPFEAAKIYCEWNANTEYDVIVSLGGDEYDEYVVQISDEIIESSELIGKTITIVRDYKGEEQILSEVITTAAIQDAGDFFVIADNLFFVKVDSLDVNGDGSVILTKGIWCRDVSSLGGKKIQILTPAVMLDDSVIPSTIARVSQLPVTSVNGMTGDVVIDIPEGFSGSWNDLTDKPFCEVNEKQTIIEPHDHSFGFFYMSSWASSGSLEIDGSDYADTWVKGEQLHVLWNGVEYVATITAPYNGVGYIINVGYPCVATITLPTSESPNFQVEAVVDGHLDVLPKNPGGFTETEVPVTFSLYRDTIVIKQLDEKFIPDTIARVTDVAKIDHTHSYNDLTDKTHYIIPGREDWLLKDYIISIEYNVNYADLTLNGDIELDSKLTIIHNDIEYLCELQYSDNDTPYFGNYHFVMSGHPDNGLPFVLVKKGSNVLRYYKPYSEGHRATISIGYVIKEQVIHLDEKFIPDTIARVADFEEISTEDINSLFA